jgi:carbon storage regulator CsrA
MLVLSRREREKIVFTNLGIQIDVVRVAGKVVRLGIDAPSDVCILRGELVDSDRSGELPSPRAFSAMAGPPDDRQRRHAVRNRLNRALLGLQVLQASVDAGKTEGLGDLIDKVFQNLNDLNGELDGSENRDRKEPASDSPPRALIVDDNANEAELLAQYLQLSGYAVDVVENGRQAIRWLQQHENPDVVLMDMNMPEMDGPSAIQRIRRDRDFGKVRLFGVSGMDRDEVGVEVGERGVDRWFTKPVDARRLVDEIRRESRSGAGRLAGC